MKRIVLTAALLVAATLGQAQYLDNSMTWTEHYNWLFGATGARGYMDYTLSIQNDTVISGMQYYRIERNGIQVDTNLSLVWPGNPLPPVISIVSDEVGFLRESGEMFYYLPSTNSTEYVLFDFGISVGDSIGSFPVLSVDTVMFDGQERRRYWTYTGNQSSYVLEGVGHTFGGLLHPSVYAYHDWWALVCASNSSMVDPYLLDSSFQCDPFSNHIIEYALPCVVPEDSAHVFAGSNSGFVYNGDTTATLYFPNTGMFTVIAFDSVSGNNYTIQFDVAPYVPQPQNLLVTGDPLICPGDSLWLCGMSGHAAYVWSTGNTAECELITHEWCWEGTIELIGVDANGCEVPYNPFSIYCGDSVTANFAWQETAQGIEFDNSSVNGTEYYWDFGDGDTSNLENPVHQFANGTYEVCLIATNECMLDTLCETIMLNTGVDEIESETSLNVRFDSGLLYISSIDRINRIEMFDVSGRRVSSQQVGSYGCELDVSALENAVYVISIWLESGRLETRKVSIRN
jgi:hypothetical protein